MSRLQSLSHISVREVSRYKVMALVKDYIGSGQPDKLTSCLSVLIILAGDVLFD